MGYMESVSGLAPEAIRAGLSGRVYYDPALSALVTAEEYLSGNVRVKLDEARLYRGDEDMEANVKALESALPPDVPAEEISLELGATWVPAAVYEQFAYEVFQLPRSHRVEGSRDQISVAYSPEHIEQGQGVRRQGRPGVRHPRAQRPRPHGGVP